MAGQGGNRASLRKTSAAPVVLSSSSSSGLGALMAEPKGMLIAAVGVFLVVGGAAFGASAVLFPHKAAVAATVGPSPAEITLGKNPELAELYATMKDSFPQDYAVLMEQTDAQLAHEDIAGATWAALRVGAMVTEREAPGVIEHADSDKLSDFMLRNAELLHVMQTKSPAVCAKIAMGSLNKDGMQPLLADPAVLTAATRATTATLVAIYGGKTRPKNYRPPANDELEMLGRGVMQQGLTKGDATVFHARDFSALTPEKQCALVLKSFRAVLGAPEPARSRFISQAAATATAKAKK
jgi:hypothetical protein